MNEPWEISMVRVVLVLLVLLGATSSAMADGADDVEG
jgi:hypothetical protein